MRKRQNPKLNSLIVCPSFARLPFCLTRSRAPAMSRRARPLSSCAGSSSHEPGRSQSAMACREPVVERVSQRHLQVTYRLPESGGNRSVPAVQLNRRCEIAAAVVDVRAQPLTAEKALEILRWELGVGDRASEIVRATIKREDPGTVPVQFPSGTGQTAGVSFVVGYLAAARRGLMPLRQATSARLGAAQSGST